MGMGSNEWMRKREGKKRVNVYVGRQVSCNYIRQSTYIKNYYNSFLIFGCFLTLFFFSHLIVSSSYCTVLPSYLIVILLHLVVPLFVSQI